MIGIVSNQLMSPLVNVNLNKEMGMLFIRIWDMKSEEVELIGKDAGDGRRVVEAQKILAVQEEFMRTHEPIIILSINLPQFFFHWKIDLFKEIHLFFSKQQLDEFVLKTNLVATHFAKEQFDIIFKTMFGEKDAHK